ncbi:hypothetical protein OT06_29710 [Paramuricea clavata]|uniref:Calx-beta domain-containing protein n=1 Tax=Paramuricea clavata TaxID=317549 RepID=A0A7D9IW60_PARCT|nr:hypothetical protein OT06_29710 [Paramuricea clavata]
MSLKAKELYFFVFIWAFASTEGNQDHNVVGFGRNFYYGKEGRSAKICLVIKKYVEPITGVITTTDETAKGGVDYNDTMLPVNITTNSSSSVCYTINLLDDGDSEGFETFTVVFTTNDTDDQIYRSRSTVTITDDDGKYCILMFFTKQDA